MTSSQWRAAEAGEAEAGAAGGMAEVWDGRGA